MDDIIVFLMLSALCLGVWFGIAWLSRYLEDRERGNKVR
jgi:hypothetical protein